LRQKRFQKKTLTQKSAPRERHPPTWESCSQRGKKQKRGIHGEFNNRSAICPHHNKEGRRKGKGTVQSERKSLGGGSHSGEKGRERRIWGMPAFDEGGVQQREKKSHRRRDTGQIIPFPEERKSPFKTGTKIYRGQRLKNKKSEAKGLQRVERRRFR